MKRLMILLTVIQIESALPLTVIEGVLGSLVGGMFEFELKENIEFDLNTKQWDDLYSQRKGKC